MAYSAHYPKLLQPGEGGVLPCRDQPFWLPITVTYPLPSWPLGLAPPAPFHTWLRVLLILDSPHVSSSAYALPLSTITLLLRHTGSHQVLCFYFFSFLFSFNHQLTNICIRAKYQSNQDVNTSRPSELSLCWPLPARQSLGTAYLLSANRE